MMSVSQYYSPSYCIIRSSITQLPPSSNYRQACSKAALCLLAYLLYSSTALSTKSSAMAKAAILLLVVSASSYMLTTYFCCHLPLQVFNQCLISAMRSSSHWICTLIQANRLACALADAVSKPAYVSLLLRACLFLGVIPADT